MQPSNAKLNFEQPAVVGVITSMQSLSLAKQLQNAADFFEVRLDFFAQHLNLLDSELQDLQCPLIITARHPAEGGAFSLNSKERQKLLTAFLDRAAVVDIELRSARFMDEVIRRAKNSNVSLLISFHDFQTTPRPVQLQRIVAKALLFEPDLVKIATQTSTPTELSHLIALSEAERRVPLSLMGMGRYGRVSRLVLAQAGSALNYGFLGSAQVAGQWPVSVLKQRIEELISTSKVRPKQSGTA